MSHVQKGPLVRNTKHQRDGAQEYTLLNVEIILRTHLHKDTKRKPKSLCFGIVPEDEFRTTVGIV